MMNLAGRNNVTKPNNVGVGIGGTSIASIGKSLVLNNQNQNSIPNSLALKDAVIGKSVNDGQKNNGGLLKSPKHLQFKHLNDPNAMRRPSESNTSFDKMILMESFRHYNKILIKNGDTANTIKHNNENNGYIGNISNPKVDKIDLKNMSLENKIAYTPTQNEKDKTKNHNSNTDSTTMSKNSTVYPPNMRIKRSSSKKNRSNNPRFFGSAEISTSVGKTKSNDSREKSGVQLNTIKSNEDFNKERSQNYEK